MAIFATQASRVTDEMFIEAARAVADQVPPDLLKRGLLYPLQGNILETEIQTEYSCDRYSAMAEGRTLLLTPLIPRLLRGTILMI